MRGVPRGCLGSIGVALALFSFGCCISSILDIVHGKGPLDGAIIAAIFFVGTTVGGAVLARNNFRDDASNPLPIEPRVSHFEEEQRVLALAQSMGGQLTLAEVALQCHLSIADSKQAFDRLIAQSIVEPELMTDGHFVYHFTGLAFRNEAVLGSATALQDGESTPPAFPASE